PAFRGPAGDPRRDAARSARGPAGRASPVDHRTGPCCGDRPRRRHGRERGRPARGRQGTRDRPVRRGGRSAVRRYRGNRRGLGPSLRIRRHFMIKLSVAEIAAMTHGTIAPVTSAPEVTSGTVSGTSATEVASAAASDTPATASGIPDSKGESGIPEISTYAGAEITGPVVVDSRLVTPGALFAALPGEHVDGHDYAAAAVSKGAAAILAARPLPGVTVPVIVVADVTLALGLLATGVLGRLPGATVVGITGSSGKT